MGVDAEMFVHNFAPLDPYELRKLSARLVEAVGLQHFGVSFPGVYEPEGRHALGLLETSRLHADRQQGEGQWIEIHLTGRYYGAGYARGNPFTYIAIANFFYVNLPDCLVYYGSDMGLDPDLFDAHAITKLVNYWAFNGRKQYTGEPKGPMCTFCNWRMHQHGYGGGYASYICHGCGDMVETRDGVTLQKNTPEWRVAQDGWLTRMRALIDEHHAVKEYVLLDRMRNAWLNY